MEFTSTIPGNARLLSTTFGRDHIQAAVIARPVFRIEGEQLVPAPEYRWPIDPMPSRTPYGLFPGDMPFLTGGIDLFVIGSAWQPQGQPGTHLIMEVRVGGGFLRRIAVFGDRRWIRSGDELVATKPAQFIEMPLTYANAYGGSVETEQGTAQWPANPHGKGFYLTAEQATEGPLPNLEDPDHPITRYDQTAESIATEPYPAEGSLRSLNSLDLDLSPSSIRIRRIKPTLFNHAHPSLILPPGSARMGDLVEITHLTPGGPLQFALPALSLEAHVELGNRSWSFPLHLDQICVLAAAGAVFLSYRTVFKYRVVPYERRRTTLREVAYA